MKLGKVIKPYVRQYEAPITLKAGELVRVTKRDMWDGQHLWLWCINGAGKEGWVHESFVEIDGDQGTARRDYNALELTVSEGEAITLLEEAGGWYWAQNAMGERGWVPTENVALD
jgi:hypothetical protein